MYLYILIFVVMIYVAEIGAYFWHRIAHRHIVPGVKTIHKIHHEANLSHEAHEDFFVVIFLLFLFGLTLYYSWIKKYITGLFLLSVYIPTVIVFTWNWYIHSAYHQKDHWLSEYSWFQNDKRIHFQHHVNPKTNYAIASNFPDIVFDTFDYGFSINDIKNNELEI